MLCSVVFSACSKLSSNAAFQEWMNGLIKSLLIPNKLLVWFEDIYLSAINMYQIRFNILDNLELAHTFRDFTFSKSISNRKNKNTPSIHKIKMSRNTFFLTKCVTLFIQTCYNMCYLVLEDKMWSELLRFLGWMR